MTNADALQAYPDSWYRAPHFGHARRVPPMGLLQPQQTTSGVDLGGVTGVVLAENAVGGGAAIEVDDFSSRKRMMSKPATASPATMKMSKPMTAIVVPTPLPVLRVGSLPTSTVEVWVEPGVFESSKPSSIDTSPGESGTI